MGKWICEACNTPCTFDSGNYGGAVNPSGGCGKENWREVKEEPEKTPAGVVTWTNVPPSGCVLIPHMAFECPECKEKDERIDGLRESHRDFVDMHNATKRDRNDHIRRLESDLSTERATTARLRNEADARGATAAFNESVDWDSLWRDATDRKLDGIHDLLETREERDAETDTRNSATADINETAVAAVFKILELLQGWEPDTTST